MANEPLQVELMVNGKVNAKDEEIHNLEIDDLISFKHPLQCTWSLWYFKQERGKHWSENQKKIASFDTIEDFWALYHYLLPISQLATGCDYSLFKEGIQPMWEDEGNKNGGRWLLNLYNHRKADQIWMDTLFCLIGEAFEEFSDEVCGAVFNIRNKNDKLGLWTRDCNNLDANMKIGKILKSRLRIGQEAMLEYQSHSDSAAKTGSMLRPAYTI